MKFQFVEEKERYNAKIKVIGVGGAGGNAINNMIASKLKGVEFIAANTDSQDIERSACSHRLQLGTTVTKGLGAGADPEIGRQGDQSDCSASADQRRRVGCLGPGRQETHRRRDGLSRPDKNHYNQGNKSGRIC